MDHTLTCDEGVLDSDFRVDDSEHGQVSLSDSSNTDLPSFTPTLVSTPTSHDRMDTSHPITEDPTSKDGNTLLNLVFDDSSVNDAVTATSELKTKLATVADLEKWKGAGATCKGV